VALHITVLPQNEVLTAEWGANLLAVLRAHGLAPDAPCGGHGTCGKCRVTVDGRELLACSLAVEHDITVLLPQRSTAQILKDGIGAVSAMQPVREGHLLAFDIGTTTVVGYLLDGKTGRELASVSCLNPQKDYGADVISRLRHAVQYSMDDLTKPIREAVQAMALRLCRETGISAAEIGVVSLVGNPAMQQLFFGVDPSNLTEIPFAPVLTEAKTVEANEFLPALPNAAMLIVPDISGYVGADTAACVLATELDRQPGNVLLVDIGTNGELVLRSGGKMLACSTAAGPALEGAKIRFGMRGAEGAIDHVRIVDGKLKCSVIGGGEAVGICGSGLIDAAAAALELGLVNCRGRIQCADEIDGERFIPLTDRVWLTQTDIRELQMAKGAIAAGIEMMAERLGIAAEEIDRVYLAGAFGTFMDPGSACRIGLLPGIDPERIVAAGNAAGGGAKLLACNQAELERAQRLTEEIDFLELAADPDFTMCFAENMGF